MLAAQAAVLHAAASDTMSAHLPKPEAGLMTSQLLNPASCRSFGARAAASCAKGAADDPLTTSSAKIPVLSGDKPRAPPRAFAVGCRATE